MSNLWKGWKLLFWWFVRNPAFTGWGNASWNPHHPRCSQLLPQWQTAEIRCNRPSKKGSKFSLRRVGKRLKLDTQGWNSTPRCKHHGFRVQFLYSQQKDHKKKATSVLQNIYFHPEKVSRYNLFCFSLFESLCFSEKIPAPSFHHHGHTSCR